MMYAEFAYSISAMLQDFSLPVVYMGDFEVNGTVKEREELKQPATAKSAEEHNN